MNLRLCNGKVPIFIGGSTPYILVDYPTKREFDYMYYKTDSDVRDRYWAILKSRRQGKTLLESGKPYGLTRERVRQIEAKFIRKVGERYFERLSSSKTD